MYTTYNQTKKRRYEMTEEMANVVDDYEYSDWHTDDIISIEPVVHAESAPIDTNVVETPLEVPLVVEAEE